MRSQFQKLVAYGIVILFLVIAANSTASAQSRTVRSLTDRLPYIDRVELVLLKVVGEGWNGEIAATTPRTGAAAQRIATLWRRQNYMRGFSGCDQPLFGIRFYRKDRLLGFATVCWDCNNIGVEEAGSRMFRGESRNGQALLRVFKEAFPQVRDAGAE